MTLELEKSGSVLAMGTFDISDAQSFMQACREVWMRLEQDALGRPANVGELMDAAGDNVAQVMVGAVLRFRTA